MTSSDSSGATLSPGADDFTRRIRDQIQQAQAHHEDRVSEAWGQAKNRMPLFARWAMGLSGSAQRSASAGASDDQ